jgi:hypothetical protein
MRKGLRRIVISAAAARVAAPAFVPPSAWGARADAGQVTDGTLAKAYSSANTYTWGDAVTYGGGYYICHVHPDYSNRTRYTVNGVAPGNSTYWFGPVGKWYYFDTSATPGTGAGNANPATAKAAPYASLLEMYDLMYGAGKTTTPRYSVFMLKRGQTYAGNVYLTGEAGGNHALFWLSAWGSGARPEVNYRNDNASGSQACILSRYNSTTPYSGGRVGNLKFNGRTGGVILVAAVSSTLTAGDTVVGSVSGCSALVLEKAGTAVTLADIAGGDAAGFRLNDTLTVTAGTNVGATATISNAGGAIAGATFNGQDFHVVHCEISACAGNGLSMGANFANSGNGACAYDNSIHECLQLGGSTATYLWSGNGSGLAASVSDTITFAYNTIDNCGNGSTSHNSYSDDLNNYLFQYNVSKNCPKGQGFNLHGVCDGVAVLNNWFDYNNNGISPAGGYASAESMANMTVAGNIISNSGYGVGNTQGYGVIMDDCLTVKIYNNLFYHSAATPIQIRVSTSGGADQLLTSAYFDFNTFYEANYGFDMQSGAYVDLRWSNNVFYHTTSSASQWPFSKSVSMSDAEMASNNNCYYAPNKSGSPPQVVQWDATGYTLAALQAAKSGKEASSQYGNPLFTNTPAIASTVYSDLIPQAGSPCKAAGSAVAWVTTDFYGNARSATAPTVGAIE